jgi:hypothetical protein
MWPATAQAGRLVECLADHSCDALKLFAAFLPCHTPSSRVQLFATSWRRIQLRISTIFLSDPRPLQALVP